MAHPLDDAKAKLAWARRNISATHAEALARELETREDVAESFGHKVERGLEPGDWVVRVDHIWSPPRHLGLMVGDVLHELRSSLDHLAWQLVLHGERSEIDPDGYEAASVQFPIYDTLARFDDNVDRRLPGADAGAIAAIRECQPEHGTTEGASLALLASLSNVDKHRVVQPIWTAPAQYTVNVHVPDDFVVLDLRVPESGEIRELQADAELARFKLRTTSSDPTRTADMQVAVLFQPYLALPGGDRVTETLRQMADVTESVLTDQRILAAF